MDPMKKAKKRTNLPANRPANMTAVDIGLNVYSNKTKFMYFKPDGANNHEITSHGK